MTAAVLDRRKRRGWRALVLRLLPWYDLAAEQKRDAHSAAIHRRAIRARMDLEQIRKAYLATGDRLHR